MPHADIEDKLRAMAQVVGPYAPQTEVPEDSINPDDNYLNNFHDKEFAQQFVGNVIDRQVPGYAEFRRRHATLMRELWPLDEDGSTIVEVGAGSGAGALDAFAALTQTHGEPGVMDERLFNPWTYVLVDDSHALLDVARNKLDEATAVVKDAAPEFSEPLCKFRFRPVLGTDYLRPQPSDSVDLSVCTLTAHFIPMMDRQEFYAEVYRTMKPGTWFLLTEKTLGNNHLTDRLMTDLYHEEKFQNGMTRQAIENKRGSLQHFLTPATIKGNYELLEQAGFREHNIDIVWKNLMFTMFLARK